MTNSIALNSFFTKYAIGAKVKKTYVKPANPRGAFIKAVTKAMEEIEKGTFGGKYSWVKKVEGGFSVELRSGIRLLPIVGTGNTVVLADLNSVKDYLTDAVEASEAGAFDEMFAAVKPPARKSKKTVEVETV